MNFDTAEVPEDHQHDGDAWDRHRAQHRPRILRIHGQSLATWARHVAEQDANRIYTALSVGLSAGDDNTDIVHRVIGGRRTNGADGVTEITRKHILYLGRGLLLKRKSRMSGSSPSGSDDVAMETQDET